MVFYGLALNAGSLPGSVYFNSSISSLCDFVGYITCPLYLANKRLGRRWSNAGFLIFGAVCVGLSTLLLEIDQACDDFNALQICAIVLAYGGRYFMSAIFGVVYVYSCEIYPSEIRSTGYALNSLGARIAGMMSPWVLATADYYSWLPGATFAVLAFVSGIAAMWLPETLGQPLLTTLEEAEEYYENKNRAAEKDEGKVNTVYTSSGE